MPRPVLKKRKTLERNDYEVSVQLPSQTVPANFQMCVRVATQGIC